MKKFFLTAAAAFICTITAMAQINFTEAMPANEETVEQLLSVHLTYPAPVSANPACSDKAVLLRNGQPVLEFDNKSRNLQYPIDQEDVNSITYIFAFSKNEFITDWGEYEFIVPEGFLYFKSLPAESNLTNAVSLKYYIPHFLEYKSDPRPGNIESLKTITLTFPEAVSIIKNPLTPDEEGNGIVRLYAYNNSENYVDNPADPNAPETDDGIPESEVISGNTVTVTFKHTYTEPGSYTMVFPFGAYTAKTADGEELINPKISLTYVKPKFPAPSLYPEPGSVFNDDLEVIYVDLADGLTYNLWFPTQTISLYKVDEKGNLTDRVGVWARNKDEVYKGTSEVCLYGPAELDVPSGEYALKFSKSTFSVDATPESGYESGWNQEFIYYYDIYNPSSGVEDASLDAPEALYDIYTLQGMRIASSAPADAVNSLPAGLYIVKNLSNGQAVKTIR